MVFGRAFPEIQQRYPAAVSDDDLTRVLEDLSRHEDDEFIDFLNRIPDRSFSQAFLQWLGACCQFQQARYDGELRGTEIGMTLFYTDLVAKLWALDYEATMPQAMKRGSFRALVLCCPPCSRGAGKVPEHTCVVRSSRRRLSESAERRDKTPALPAERHPRVFGVERPARARARRSRPTPPMGDSSTGGTTTTRRWPGSSPYQRLNAIMKWSVLLRGLIRV